MMPVAFRIGSLKPNGGVLYSYVEYNRIAGNIASLCHCWN